VRSKLDQLVHQASRDVIKAAAIKAAKQESDKVLSLYVAALRFAFTSAAVHAQPALRCNQVHAGCVDIGARVRRLGCVAPRYGLVGVGLPRQTERAAGRRQGAPKPQCAALPRRRCQCGQRASSRAGRNAPTLTLTLSTGSAGGPCRYGVLTGYSESAQGVLRNTQGVPSVSACRPSGSRGCRSPHEPRQPLALRTAACRSTKG
jgi:hypothetical protein